MPQRIKAHDVLRPFHKGKLKIEPIQLIYVRLMNLIWNGLGLFEAHKAAYFLWTTMSGVIFMDVRAPTISFLILRFLIKSHHLLLSWWRKQTYQAFIVS